MIREIQVSHYQSLRSLKVRLGRFTVLTGPSSTGKSSFIRAVRLLAFNARGTAFVTRGEKACSVTMLGEDPELARPDEDLVRQRQWKVVIQRGSKDAYLLDPAQELSQKTYTKLAGKVPDPVTEVLRLGEVNFAGQFDPPYLLDATGGEVARVLGKLTNVTLIYKAAQEANRRRLQASGLLKTRVSDLSVLLEQVRQYDTLGDEEQSVVEAEAAWLRMSRLDEHRSKLAWEMMNYEHAARRLAEDPRLRPVPEPPSLARMEELAVRRSKLDTLMSGLGNAEYQQERAARQEADAVVLLRASMAEQEKYAAQWGVCPACGQPVKKEHDPHAQDQIQGGPS